MWEIPRVDEVGNDCRFPSKTQPLCQSVGVPDDSHNAVQFAGKQVVRQSGEVWPLENASDIAQLARHPAQLEFTGSVYCEFLSGRRDELDRELWWPAGGREPRSIYASGWTSHTWSVPRDLRWNDPVKHCDLSRLPDSVRALPSLHCKTLAAQVDWSAVFALIRQICLGTNIAYAFLARMGH